MNTTSPNMSIYELFESQIRDGFKSLIVKPESITASIKYDTLTKITEPDEEFELEVKFPGATCLISFEQSSVYKEIFFSLVQFKRPGQRTLLLDNYLAHQKDQRKDLLTFKVTEITIDQGISRIVDVLVEVFNKELCPLLEGLAWFTAPVDWAGYK